MTLYGVIAAALVRKVKALVAEYRKLVAEATQVEEGIVSAAEAKAAIIIMDAKAAERAVIAKAKAETSKLREDLIDAIAKI